MKQYVIDELRSEDYEKIKVYLDKNLHLSGIPGIFWIHLDKRILNDIQADHSDCQPFYFALELEQSRMTCEFLVRSAKRIRCNCIEYADEKQRNWLIGVVDAIFEKLKIKI